MYSQDIFSFMLLHTARLSSSGALHFTFITSKRQRGSLSSQILTRRDAFCEAINNDNCQ